MASQEYTHMALAYDLEGRIEILRRYISTGRERLKYWLWLLFTQFELEPSVTLSPNDFRDVQIRDL